MSLLDVTVRADWQAVEKRDRAARALWRRALQIALLAFSVIALVPALLAPDSLWRAAVSLLGFVAAYWVLPAVWRLSRRPGARLTNSVGTAVCLVNVAIALITMPVAPSSSWPVPFRLPPVVAQLIPALSIALAWWSNRRHPGLLRAYGLMREGWLRQTLTGIAAGLALGAHLWIILFSITRIPPHIYADLARVVWILALIGGLRAPGEELILRGVLYRLLTADGAAKEALAYLQIVALNLPLYLAPVLGRGDPLMLCVGAVYGAAFSLLAIGLRRAHASALAPLAANIVFNTMFALVAY